MPPMPRVAALVLALGLSACGAPRSASISPPQVLDDEGIPRALAVRVCRPAATRGAAPLAVINHGAPTHSEDTPRMQPTGCDSEPAQWFTARGFVVVFALRRGFGASGGAIAEDSGTCEAPDYVHAGEEGARDIAAVVRWAEALPGVRDDATVVVGQSTGGWASLAYAGRSDARAVAVINMAGGRGGRAFGAAGTYCHPERLVAAAGALGAAARLPTLWIYASNDSYFTPDLATRMHAAFSASGAHAVFVQTPPFGFEGHLLFYAKGGASVWGPAVERFLRETLPGSAIPLS